MDFASAGTRPTLSNRASTNPASRSSSPSVAIDQNLMCPWSHSAVKCRSTRSLTAGAKFFQSPRYGVELADAVTFFHDLHTVTLEDGGHHEQRFVTVGIDAFGRVLVVVYAYGKSDTIRIISARKADPGERKQYES